MLNGPNAFNAAGGPPGNGGFPAMGAPAQAQYGGGQGQRSGLAGLAPRGGFPGQMGVGGGGMGVGPGAQVGMQSPFNAGPPMGQGGGQRLSLDGRGPSGANVVPPPGLQRQSSGGSPLAGARAGPGGPGMMGGSGSGSFPRPAAVAGSPMGAGGADLLAMINKQQHGGANLAAFGGGGNAFMGAGGASGRGDDGAAPPGFDLNDFPSLGDSGNPGGPSRQMSGGMGLDAGGAAGAGSGFGARANPGGLHPGGFFGGMDGMGSADGYGVVSLQKPHPEFTMQNEDFPALPGAPGMGGSPAGKSAAADRRAFSRGGVFVPSATRSNGGFPGPERVVGAAGSEYGEPLGSIESCVSSNAASNGSHGGRGVGPVPNVSVSIGGRSGGTVGGGSDDGVGTSHLGRSPRRDSEVETFGLLGLLGVIRMSDPDVTTLRLGTDLTTLGLNLNSPEPLYRTFGSPWSDAAPLRELELAVPACYAVRARPLSPSTFAKFQQETLFYVFYGSPGEEAQARAADELVNRGWGFHKELKAWLTRVAGAEPARRTARGERGSFWIFDANVWEKVRKDNFNLQYDVLERRPFVPGKDGGKEASSFGSLAGAGLE